MNDFQSNTDDELLGLAAGGNDAAFTALYRRRQSGIYRFALHMSGSASVAEEVTQDVFLALIRNFGAYNPQRGTLSAFLYGIARNLVLRSFEMGSFCILDPALASGASPLADLTRNEAIAGVRQAVLSLPETYREAIVLCDLEEVSYAEAAEILGVPVGTVRSRLNRGRSMLADKLQGKVMHHEIR